MKLVKEHRFSTKVFYLFLSLWDIQMQKEHTDLDNVVTREWNKKALNVEVASNMLLKMLKFVNDFFKPNHNKRLIH